MENSKRKLSIFSGSLLIVNSMFGAGVISLPGCFVKLGYANSALVLAMSVLFTFISLQFLTYSAECLQNFSYAGMCQEIGRPLAIMLDLAIVLNCYGSTLSYVLYMVGYIQKLLPEFAYNKTLVSGTIGLTIMIPLFFLARLRSLNKLSMVSWLTVGSTMLAAFELLSYKMFSNYKTSNDPVPAFNNEYAKGLAPIIFSLGCQQTAVSIYFELENRSMASSTKTMGFGCLLGGCIYAALGYLGSSLFGSFTESDFLDIFVEKNSHFVKYIERSPAWMSIPPKICVLSFILVLFSAFPIQTFAARNSLFNMWANKSLTKKNIFLATSIQFLLIYGFVLAGKKPSEIIEFMGAVAGPMVSFIFPSIIYMKVVGKRKVTFYLAALMVLSSIFIMGFCLHSLLLNKR